MRERLLDHSTPGVGRPSDGDLDLACFNGQRHTSLRPHLKAELDRLLNVLHCQLLGSALADGAWNCRAFDDPNTIFVTVNRYCESHRGLQIGLWFEPYLFNIIGSAPWRIRLADQRGTKT